VSQNLPITGRTAIVLAAGSGTRLGSSTNKVWLPLGGRELATWSFQWLIATKLFDRFVAVIHPLEIDQARKVLNKHLDVPIDLIEGGSSRHDSEFRALEYIAPSIEAGICQQVLIHDGARPLAAPSLIQRLIQAADETGGALPYLPSGNLVGEFPIQSRIVRVQTPQVFTSQLLLDSYRQAEAAAFEGTDTASCVERFHPEVEIKTVYGSAQNLKVTYPQDLVMAEHILSSQGFELR
jgi:2-C-methyl-D-erythritol 4-phosphate cytidylyltransferase